MRHIARLLIPMAAASVLLAACGSGGSSSSSSTSSPATTNSAAVVKTASNTAAGGTILVNRSGMTLYSLSAERNGRFICTTSACLGVWHPLTVAKGTQPTGGVASLGTVKRPDGTTQVTYQGEPLYTFAQDVKAGDANGQGIKDVGTWSAVKATGGSTTTPTTPSTSGGSSPGGY